MSRMRDGREFYPEERVTRDQALHMYTTGAAWMEFAENSRGTLEKGKLADMIVLSKDIVTIPASQIDTITVNQTWVGGELVFAR